MSEGEGRMACLFAVSLDFNEDVMQNYEAGGGEKEEGDLGVAALQDFHFFLHSPSPLIPSG